MKILKIHGAEKLEGTIRIKNTKGETKSFSFIGQCGC